MTGILIGEEGLVAQAMSHWPALAAQLDTPPVRPSVRVLSCRLQPEGQRIVLRLSWPDHPNDATPDLVLKHEATGKSSEAFAAEVDAHRHALGVMGPEAVPQILAADVENRVVVMAHVPGQSAHDLLELAELGLEDGAEVMRRCGGWLRRYHDCTEREARSVNPDAMLTWAATLRQKVSARAPDVPRRDLFLTCASRVAHFGEAARGKSTRICASHGDMHLRNLLLSPDHCWGIDFGPLKYVPPAHDLGRFLVRYANHFDPADTGGDAAGSGQAMDPLQAFWQGYGGEHQQDPALSYILPILLLDDWTAIPKQRANRSPREQRRLKGTLRLARALFDL